MVVEHVGFHLNFGAFKQNRHSLEGFLSHSLSTRLILQDWRLLTDFRSAQPTSSDFGTTRIRRRESSD